LLRSCGCSRTSNSASASAERRSYSSAHCPHPPLGLALPRPGHAASSASTKDSDLGGAAIDPRSTSWTAPVRHTAQEALIRPMPRRRAPVLLPVWQPLRITSDPGRSGGRRQVTSWASNRSRAGRAATAGNCRSPAPWHRVQRANRPQPSVASRSRPVRGGSGRRRRRRLNRKPSQSARQRARRPRSGLAGLSNSPAAFNSGSRGSRAADGRYATAKSSHR
jgi:hypothetical protein